MTTPSLKRFKDLARALGWPNPFANWSRTGFTYFDTTLGKPVWRDPTSATGWSDATGADA
jgi:hypothetical protein